MNFTLSYAQYMIHNFDSIVTHLMVDRSEQWSGEELEEEGLLAAAVAVAQHFRQVLHLWSVMSKHCPLLFCYFVPRPI